jgi:DNA-binding NarL/FixJ family response regulator
MDNSQAPEEVLFQEELSPSLRDQVHTIIPQLIPAQQELFWKLCEGRQLGDIAREEGTTDNAIRSRRRKMFDRIRALYAEKFGDA